MSIPTSPPSPHDQQVYMYIPVHYRTSRPIFCFVDLSWPHCITFGEKTPLAHLLNSRVVIRRSTGERSVNILLSKVLHSNFTGTPDT